MKSVKPQSVKVPEERESTGDSYPLDKPSKLADIRRFTQEVALATAAVTRIDFSIIDENLVRVSGSGNYIDEVDFILPAHSISDQILKTGQVYVLEHPREDPRCKKCSYMGHCKELAEISYPVVLNGTPIGNMVLVAFTKEQRKLLLEHRNDYIEFLSKIANLLVNKIESKEKARQVSLLKQQLETLINKIDQGIVYVDENGKVQFFNTIAKQYLLEELNYGLLMEYFLPEISWPVTDQIDKLVSRDNETYSVSVKPLEGVGALVEIQLITTIQRKEHDIRRRMATKTHVAEATFDDLVGNHPEFLKTVEIARKYSVVDATVLITAETGTGKELFAQSLHNMSPRRNGPFVAVNCAALPESLLESELFGYVGGAFTGAKRSGKVGLFEQAHRGTIFLDEIAEMPFRLQSSLLRVLQHKEVMRIGDDKLIPVDVRIITATNKDLRALVDKEQFREDLYYRLNILRLEIPPLRRRREDIPLLVQHFAIQVCRTYKRPPISFSKECGERLSNHHWPGNIRELYNVIQRAVLLAVEPIINVNVIDGILEHTGDEGNVQNQRFDLDLTGSFKDIQRQIIQQLFEGSKSEDEVARILGISKTTLWRRMNAK